jgi:PPOX class probable F420-dependent enzyme
LTRELIGNGADATLVTVNPDGSPQVSLVWVALRSTPDGDELVTAHLAEHKKVRNVRRDPRVAVTIASPGDVGKSLRSYLAIDGTARIEEGARRSCSKLCRRHCWTPACSRRRMRRPDS